MNCIFCGQPLRDGAVFCSACGKKQPNSAQSDTPSSSGQPTPVISPDGNRVASFCYSCKASLPAGATVCPQCGAKINRTKKEIKKPRRKLKKVIGGIIVALVCLILAGTLLLTAAGVGIAAILLNKQNEPQIRGSALLDIGDKNVALYGDGQMLSFSESCQGIITANEKYAVYVDSSYSYGDKLFLYNIKDRKEKEIHYAESIKIMGDSDSGVFFCDENDVYSYNFKKDSVYPLFKNGAPYCISLYNSEKMSIAFVEGYDIYTFEVSEERKSSINTKRNTDPDIYLYNVSTDGKAVVWGSGNTILFSTESVASDLYSANFSFENDTDAQSPFFSMWSIIYETKYDNAFLLATDKDDIFFIRDGIVEYSVQAPFGAIYSSEGIPAELDQDFDPLQPFYNKSRNGNLFNLSKVYMNERRTMTVCEKSPDLAFFGEESVVFIEDGYAYIFSGRGKNSIDLKNVSDVFASPYGKEIAYFTVARSDGGEDLYRYTQKDGVMKLANNVSNVRISYCGEYVYYVYENNRSLYVHDGNEATVILEKVDSGTSFTCFIYGGYLDPEAIWIFTTDGDVKFFDGKTTAAAKNFGYIR